MDLSLLHNCMRFYQRCYKEGCVRPSEKTPLLVCLKTMKKEESLLNSPDRLSLLQDYVKKVLSADYKDNEKIPFLRAVFAQLLHDLLYLGKDVWVCPSDDRLTELFIQAFEPEMEHGVNGGSNDDECLQRSRQVFIEAYLIGSRVAHFRKWAKEWTETFIDRMHPRQVDRLRACYERLLTGQEGASRDYYAVLLQSVRDEVYYWTCPSLDILDKILEDQVPEFKRARSMSKRKAPLPATSPSPAPKARAKAPRVVRSNLPNEEDVVAYFDNDDNIDFQTFMEKKVKV